MISISSLLSLLAVFAEGFSFQRISFSMLELRNLPVTMTPTQHSAIEKLSTGSPPFDFEDLPTSRSDPIWIDIKDSYNLSLSQICSLKNAKCGGEDCLFRIRFVFSPTHTLINHFHPAPPFNLFEFIVRLHCRRTWSAGDTDVEIISELEEMRKAVGHLSQEAKEAVDYLSQEAKEGTRLTNLSLGRLPRDNSLSLSLYHEGRARCDVFSSPVFGKESMAKYVVLVCLCDPLQPYPNDDIAGDLRGGSWRSMYVQSRFLDFVRAFYEKLCFTAKDPNEILRNNPWIVREENSVYEENLNRKTWVRACMQRCLG
jgi:hypothetical protein